MLRTNHSLPSGSEHFGRIQSCKSGRRLPSLRLGPGEVSIAAPASSFANPWHPSRGTRHSRHGSSSNFPHHPNWGRARHHSPHHPKQGSSPQWRGQNRSSGTKGRCRLQVAWSHHLGWSWVTHGMGAKRCKRLCRDHGMNRSSGRNNGMLSR